MPHSTFNSYFRVLLNHENSLAVLINALVAQSSYTPATSTAFELSFSDRKKMFSPCQGNATKLGMLITFFTTEKVAKKHFVQKMHQKPYGIFRSSTRKKIRVGGRHRVFLSLSSFEVVMLKINQGLIKA